ncbi:hypothetical protein ABEB36_003776 [Hypothenemus hampei]|uniref:Uncharacterized protein n=1 Tax=Hypothenemus hampei TaxID=57062 RepID=A0ABD1F472_HYPHA
MYEDFDNEMVDGMAENNSISAYFGAGSTFELARSTVKTIIKVHLFQHITGVDGLRTDEFRTETSHFLKLTEAKNHY